MIRAGIVCIVAIMTVGYCAVAVAKRGGGRELVSSSSYRFNAPNIKPALTPVIVELFTSEGCSSCPPADELLARLAKHSPVDGVQIIPLSEHVDYWNHLGWADPYSSSAFTNRQRSYAQLMHLDQVYTPQMVVDGSKEMLGSDGDGARSAIAGLKEAPKAETTIVVDKVQATDVSLVVHVEAVKSPKAGETTDVIVAITEDNLVSSVARGENVGRRLTHTGVVRHVESIGHVSRQDPFESKVSVSLQKSWKRPDLHAVVFVQGHDSGRIYGAATAVIQ